MRTVLGVVLGILLVFPGIVVLQNLSDAMGFYDDMTLTDGCLIMIIILLSINLLKSGFRADSARRPDPSLTSSSSKGPARQRKPLGRTRP